ncbi:MAG TPA: alkaline phosphatase family protein [Ktedonobacteraceae bacterium]|jgi:acid phosphatase
MKTGLSITCWNALSLVGLIIVIISCSSTPNVGAISTVTPVKTIVPRPDHVVIVMEENHDFSEIIGSSSAPYINALASLGASLTDSHAVTHPSEPNYLALFAGSTFGLSDDSCPNTFTSANLAQELIHAHGTFGGYSEDLPSVGYTGCSSSNYARKHNPWVNFTNVPSSVNMPLTKFPTNPANYRLLPTISIVIPNLQDDMHDGTVGQGDTWLQSHINSYVTWAKTHRSLLIVTWDEDDNSNANQIPTIFVGPMVKAGKYGENVSHYNVLRTLESMYGLAPVGSSAKAAPIMDIWQAKVGV